MDQNKYPKNMRVGDPLHRSPEMPTNSKTDKSGERKAPAPAKPHRDGDFGVGIPHFEPREVRELSESEEQELTRQQQEQLREEFTEKLKALESTGYKWNIPVGIRKLGFWCMLAMAAVLGLVLISQTAAFAGSIKELPKPFNWIGAISAGLFAILLVIVIIKLLWQAVSFRRSPGVSIRALAVLEQRQRFRVLVNQRSDEVRKQLEDYLRDYPLTGEGRKRLIAMGLSSDEADRLAQARDYLLDTNTPREYEHWLDDFSRSFHAILDKLASKRVREYALKVGTGTGLSPIAFVDQMIVLYSSTAMIRDLMCIYQLRPAFGQTGVILSRAILNTYLSGMIEEASGKAAENISESIGHWSSQLGGILGSSLGRAISARATEAALNALLISRLGNKTIKQLAIK